jgi:hypothetical protein
MAATCSALTKSAFSAEAEIGLTALAQTNGLDAKSLSAACGRKSASIQHPG